MTPAKEILEMIWTRIKCLFGKHGGFKDGTLYWMIANGFHQFGTCEHCNKQFSTNITQMPKDTE